MRRVTWPVGRGWVNIARAFDPPPGGGTSRTVLHNHFALTKLNLCASSYDC